MIRIFGALIPAMLKNVYSIFVVDVSGSGYIQSSIK